MYVTRNCSINYFKLVLFLIPVTAYFLVYLTQNFFAILRVVIFLSIILHLNNRVASITMETMDKQ